MQCLPFFVLLLDPANTGGLARRCCTSILSLQADEQVCFVSVLAVLAHEAMLGECFVSVVALLAHEAWLWGMTTRVMRPLWRAINKRMNFPWNLIGDAS